MPDYTKVLNISSSTAVVAPNILEALAILSNEIVCSCKLSSCSFSATHCWSS